MENIIHEELKAFKWDKILSVANGLDELNVSQWRFLKATIIEMSVEKHSNNNLKYVAQKHCDFIWEKFNKKVELKSNCSMSMYKKRRWWEKKKNYTILLTNTMGTNKKDTPSVADIIICVYNDGAFYIDRKTAFENLRKNGDGFVIVVNSDSVVSLTEKQKIIKTKINIKEKIMQHIKDII